MVFYAKKQNAIFNLNLLLSIILILSTVINNGNINKCLNYVSPMLGTVSLITYYFGIHKDKELLRVFKIVLFVYIIINLITYFAFPNGLYTTELVTQTSHTQNGIRTLKNQYFSPQSILK